MKSWLIKEENVFKVRQARAWGIICCYCFLCSACIAAELGITHATWRVSELSGDMTQRSIAAGLPNSQLGIRISAGRVCIIVNFIISTYTVCTTILPTITVYLRYSHGSYAAEPLTKIALATDLTREMLRRL